MALYSRPQTLFMLKRTLRAIQVHGTQQSQELDLVTVKKHYKMSRGMDISGIEEDEKRSYRENHIHQFVMREMRKYQELDPAHPSDAMLIKEKQRSLEMFVGLNDAVVHYDFLIKDMRVGQEKDSGMEHVKRIANRVGLAIPDQKPAE